MLPKEYFEDTLTKGVAFGALQHVQHNRFTLLKLPVGYGKTIISMQVARALAKNGRIQIMIIAPKAKRLDNSFREAVDSCESHYGISMNIVPINGQEVGTFAGLNVMKTKKPEMYAEFLKKLEQEDTLLILDETHMQLRDATKTANGNFRKIFRHLEDNSDKELKILGLTATPFDTSILDTVGYLVLNGDYHSRNDFYKKEIVGFKNAFKRGLNMSDINHMIVDETFRIHGEMFVDKRRVVNKLKQIIYAPDAPKTFHIPENEFADVNVTLSPEGLERLAQVEKMDRQRAYSDNTTKCVDYVKTLTTDENVIDTVIRLCRKKDVSQPLVFYNFDVTLEGLKKKFAEQGMKWFEVNGHSSSYFSENDGKSPVFVQYQSGATAFESKSSNTSIYLDLPASDINYQQSLGRNTRRGQNVKTVINYIIRPYEIKNGCPVAVLYAEKQYNRIVSKNRWNKLFENVFVTKWGTFSEDVFEKAGKRKCQ